MGFWENNMSKGIEIFRGCAARILREYPQRSPARDFAIIVQGLFDILEYNKIDIDKLIDNWNNRNNQTVPPPKIGRNTSTPEGAKFWAYAEKCAQEVANWPKWKQMRFKSSLTKL